LREHRLRRVELVVERVLRSGNTKDTWVEGCVSKLCACRASVPRATRRAPRSRTSVLESVCERWPPAGAFGRGGATGGAGASVESAPLDNANVGGLYTCRDGSGDTTSARADADKSWLCVSGGGGRATDALASVSAPVGPRV
jgi:hypothetical protein